MVEAFAVVNVGKIECEFSKRTPVRSSADMAGACCGVTELGRSPSATNRMTLCGAVWAMALVASAVLTNKPLIS